MSAPVPRACVPARCLFLFPRPARSLTLSLSPTRPSLAAITCLAATHLDRFHMAWQPSAQNAPNAPRLSRVAGPAENARSNATRQNRIASSVAAGAGRAGVTAHDCSGWPLRFHILFVSAIQTLLLLPLPPWRKGPPVCCGECFHRVMQHSSRPTYTIMF